MNKLFTKIVGACLGLTMAIGVGVAVGSNGKAAELVEASTSDGTAATSITSGKKYFICVESGSNYIYLPQYTSDVSGSSVASATIAKTGTITEDMCWTFTASSSSYTISCKSGNTTYYLGNTNTNNGMKVSTTSQTWTASYASSKWTITGGNSRKLSYYSSSPYNWRCYSSSSGNQNILLFEYAAAKTLSSIAVTTPPTTTTYYVGQSFSSTGMVVTATYSDKSTANVTSSCTFTPDPFTTTGSQNVTVSYTEGGVNKTATQAVTVEAVTAASINGSTTASVGQQWSATNITEDVGGAVVTGATYSFSGVTFSATDTVNGTFTASAAGTVTVSATKFGFTIASKTVTVTFAEPGHVTGMSISQIAGIGKGTLSEKAYIYEITGYVTANDNNKMYTYGNFYISDTKNDTTNQVYVYGATQTASQLSFNSSTGKYSFASSSTNAASLETAGMVVGSKITANFIALYHNSTFEFQGVVTSVSNDVEVNSLSISGTDISNNSLSIGSSDNEAHSVNVSLSPANATNQDVSISHLSGTQGLFNLSSSAISCSNGSGSFTITGTGGTSGSETFRIASDADSTKKVDLVVSAYDDTITHFTVTFDSDGGTDPANLSVADGDTFKFPSPGEKEHYSFIGWTSDTETFFDPGETSPEVVDDIDYYGFWGPDDKFTATYISGENGSGASVVVTDIWDGDKITLKSFAECSFTADTGFSFKCWKIGNTEYASGVEYTVTGDVTIEAVYRGQSTFSLYTGALVEGDYLVVYDGAALNTTESGSRLQYTSVTASNDKILTSDSSIIWHIAVSGDYYTMYNASASAYAAATGSKNQAQMLADGSDDKSLWSCENDSNSTSYDFANKARANGSDSGNKWLRKNGNFGFACYASGTGGALSLYKEMPVLSSVSTSGQKESFVAGEKFAYNGTLTAHYTLNKADATVIPTSFKYGASGINPTSAGTAITTNDTITYENHYGKYIYVLYTEDNVTKYLSYPITVSYKPLTGITLDNNELSMTVLGVDSTKTLTATISDQYADPSTILTWKTSDDDVVDFNNETTSFSGDSITVVSVAEGDATITVFFDANENDTLDSGEKYATCSVTVLGQQLLTIVDSENNVVSDTTINKYTGEASFMLQAKSENYPSPTYTWDEDSNESVVSLSTADDLVEITIEGVGTAIVSVTVGSMTKTVTISVTQSSVGGVTISESGPGYVYVGSTFTLHASLVNPTGSAVGTGINWDSSSKSIATVSNNGVVTGVSHGTSTITAESSFDSSKKATFTIIVVGLINSITHDLSNDDAYDEPASYSYEKITDVDDIVSGENYLIVYEDDDSSVVFDGSLETLDAVGNTTPLSDFSSSSGTASYFTIEEAEGGGYTILSQEGKYIGQTSNANGLASSSEIAYSNTISFNDDGSVNIVSSGAYLRYNYASNQLRFRYYKSASYTGQQAIALYKISDTPGQHHDSTYSTVEYANAEGMEKAQWAVIAYAETINTEMNKSGVCDANDHSNMDTAWSNIQSTYESIFVSNSVYSLSSDEIAHAKDMLRYIENPTWSSTSLPTAVEHAMKTYDFCVDKYEMPNFMFEADGETPLRNPQKTGNMPLSLLNNVNTNTITMIVIISMVSVTAIGGYFFLRRRKENI